MKKIIFSNKYLMKILYYGLLSMLLLFIILNQKLGNMDEIWNFSFAKNIHDGLIPYKDFNIISTPFSIFLNSITLNIDSSLITFRITYFVYYLVILYILDNILDKLNIKQILKYIIIFLSVMILVKTCYLDYNFIQLILLLLLVYLNLKNKDYKNKKLNILIPLISGLTIINKQSSGMVIATVNIILILLKKYYYKKNIKFKFMLNQIIFTVIPIILFMIYLLITNSFNEFYDLAILGIITFKNNYLSKIFFFEIIVIYIVIILEMYFNRQKLELWILFLYSLASLSFLVPILDIIHAAFPIIIPFIFLIYIIDSKLKNINISNGYVFFVFPILIFLIATNLNSYATSTKNNIGIYKYIPTDNIQQKIIESINNYEITMSNEYDVYILDLSASLFNLNIGKYNKYFDIFNNGNFGINGKREMINIIDSDNKIFLINDMNNHWQTPTEIINYIKDKYYICGSIEYLTVYCSKKLQIMTF